MKTKKQEKSEISITLTAQAYFLSGIRQFTFHFLESIKEIEKKWIFRMQAVVDELCTNAIEYGSKEGEKITFSIQHEPKKSLEIIVEDSGTGKQKTHAKMLEKIVKDELINERTNCRGRGLGKIVAKWTDELIFEDRKQRGVRVRAIKHLPIS